MVIVPEFNSRTRVDIALVTESAATNKSLRKLRSDLLKEADEPIEPTSVIEKLHFNNTINFNSYNINDFILTCMVITECVCRAAECRTHVTSKG